jgi:trypsin
MRGGSSQRSTGGILFGMAEFILHPNYDDWTLDFDAAVMRGTGSFVGTNVAPIPLIASGTAVPAGWDAVVSGWGLTETGGALPERLQAVNKPTWLNEPCDQLWGPGEITEK